MKFRPVLFALVFGVASAIALGGSALARDKAEDLKKLPGYVDFEALDIFGDQEAKIEVYLREPLLNLVSEVFRLEEPEMYEMMSNLKLVRVQVFDIDPELARKVAAVTAETAKRLEKKGWERVVRVRDEEEHVDVYVKPSDEYDHIEGIVVMVVGDDDEAVFINIVGSIRPEDIGRLGQHFDIEQLDSMRYEVRNKKRNR